MPFLLFLTACSQPDLSGWRVIEQEIYREFIGLTEVSEGFELLDPDALNVWDRAAVFRHLVDSKVLQSGQRWREPARSSIGTEVDPSTRASQMLRFAEMRIQANPGRPPKLALVVTALRSFVLQRAKAASAAADMDSQAADRLYSELEGLDMVVRGYWLGRSGELNKVTPLLQDAADAGGAVHEALKLSLSSAGLLNDVVNQEISVSRAQSAEALAQALILLNDALAVVDV